MSKLLQKAFERAKTLSADQQDAAGAALLDYLEHSQSFQLSDEQLAEVRRRLAEPNPKFLTLDEARLVLRG